MHNSEIKKRLDQTIENRLRLRWDLSYMLDGFWGWGGEWGYLKLRWGLSETSRNTTPPRAPNGTKKKQMQNQKKFIQKKAIVELHPWKLPYFLKILACWVDFFANGLLIYSVSDHTMQCCTRKPFWVAKPKPQSCYASAFPYFEADAELGVIDKYDSYDL